MFLLDFNFVSQVLSYQKPNTETFVSGRKCRKNVFNVPYAKMEKRLHVTKTTS
jgi:hypothetical protein